MSPILGAGFNSRLRRGADIDVMDDSGVIGNHEVEQLGLLQVSGEGRAFALQYSNDPSPDASPGTPGRSGPLGPLLLGSFALQADHDVISVHGDGSVFCIDRDLRVAPLRPLVRSGISMADPL